MNEEILSSLSPDPYGILMKLFFHQNMSPMGLDLIRQMGWVHLTIASGIHLYAMLHLWEWVLSRFLKWVPLKWVPFLRTLAILIASVFLFQLWSFQNFRVGFLRPVLQFTIRRIFSAFWGKPHAWVPILLTLTFEIIVGFDGGRAHYYLAVGGGALGRSIFKRKGSFFEHLAMSIGSWLGVAVLDLLQTGILSPHTILINMMTVTWFSAVLYPLLGLGLIFESKDSVLFFSKIWSESFDLFQSIFDEIGRSIVVSSPIEVGFSAVLVFLFFFIRNRFIRLPLMIAGLAFLSSIKDLPVERVVLMDVGQGDSMLIQTDQRSFLVDVGRAVSPKDILARYLGYGVSKWNGVIISHLDSDHYGNLSRLLALMPVQKLILQESFWSTDKGKILRSDLQVLKTLPLMIDPIATDLPPSLSLFPLQEVIKSKGRTIDWDQENRRMLGVSLHLSNGPLFVNLGDAGKDLERSWVSSPEVMSMVSRQHRNKDPLILKVNHHGSRSSSDVDFLRALQPSEAWISVGRKNGYRHPHPAVLQRFHSLGIPTFRTDHQGDLVWVRSNNKNPLRVWICRKWLEKKSRFGFGSRFRSF